MTNNLHILPALDPPPSAPLRPGEPTPDRRVILAALILQDAARRQADPPAPAVLSLYLPAWDDTLAAIPDTALDAVGRQALRDHASPYPLTAGDVLKTWQGLQPEYSGPARPRLAMGAPGPIPPDAPPVALLRLLTQAVLSRGWTAPPGTLITTLLDVYPGPVESAAAVAPMLRAATGWADVAAWVDAGVRATPEDVRR